MSVQIVIFILAIGFYLVKYFLKNQDEAPAPKPKAKPIVAKQQSQQTQQTSTQKQKSIDDIFNEFVKEVEQANKKTDVKRPVVSQKKVANETQFKKEKALDWQQVSKSKTGEKALDWQQVSKSKIETKERLIDQSAYKNVSHRVDDAHKIESIAEIQDSEGEIYEFDVDAIDWKTAVISKEILDRKYA